jgi:hypothetical protein
MHVDPAQDPAPGSIRIKTISRVALGPVVVVACIAKFFFYKNTHTTPLWSIQWWFPYSIGAQSSVFTLQSAPCRQPLQKNWSAEFWITGEPKGGMQTSLLECSILECAGEPQKWARAWNFFDQCLTLARCLLAETDAWEALYACSVAAAN